jgi:signal transduction histidine kinase
VPTTLVLAQFAAASTAPAQDDHKQILVLYSTRRDAEFSVVGESELPRILDVGLARALDYYSEFLDVTRFPDPAYTVGFADFLRLKYSGIRFDLVIAMQDVAVEFLNGHRDRLFPDTPVVYFTNNPAAPRGPNSTGLILERNYTATLTLLEHLQPDVRHIFVVTGAAAADRAYESAVRTQLQSFDSRLSVTYLTGLATDELEQRLAALPERSAVYYVLVTQDGAGNRFHPLDYVERVAAAANAPTYCWVDSAMGRGIVGGSLYTQRAAIERTGQLALRVLRGERADTIPVSGLELNANEVDWRQLRRWNIDEARVPAGTLVRFRDPSVWDRYKVYIVGALILMVTQTVLITALLVQRARRRQAETQLRGSEAELRASYERLRHLGARLLNAQETERSRIARDLHDDIGQRMALLTMDLEMLGGTHEGGTTKLAAEALTRAHGIARSVHDMSHRLHPARLRLIGLVGALHQLRLELSQSGIAITFEHDSVPPALPADLMLCLFRIAQEALQNAIKYSHASEVSVRLQGGYDGLTLTVADKGAGFDVTAAWGKGLGLVSMTERVEALGGSLEILSTPGVGTQVKATVPIPVARNLGERPPGPRPASGPGLFHDKHHAV